MSCHGSSRCAGLCSRSKWRQRVKLSTVHGAYGPKLVLSRVISLAALRSIRIEGNEYPDRADIILLDPGDGAMRSAAERYIQHTFLHKRYL